MVGPLVKLHFWGVFSSKSDLNLHHCPAHPHATDPVLYTALVAIFFLKKLWGLNEDENDASIEAYPHGHIGEEIKDNDVDCFVWQVDGRKMKERKKEGKN